MVQSPTSAATKEATAAPAATITPQRPSPTPSPTITASPTVIPITELLFTGVIVPARCVQAAIDENGNADFIYEDMHTMIANADLAVGTLNAALSDYAPRTGCVRTFVLVGGSENADALAVAGFDVVSVATNHIKNCGPTDCGDRAFLDTLKNLRRVGIEPVGAGENLDEALKPIVATINGVRFGFVSLGEIEARAFAADDTPGIAVLTDENLQASIESTKNITDVVIVLPHWGSDYSETPNYRQLHFAQVAVDAGADVVIGNHAHVIQGMQNIDGVPVFYGLGNFVFDQSWSSTTQQGIVVRMLFEGSRYISHEVIPVHIDNDGHVYIPETEEAAEILGRFQSISAEIP